MGKYKELDDEVGKFGGMGLQRCKRIKKDGDRCKNAPMKGQSVCHKHGGKAPQNLRKAAERLAAAAPGAAERIEHLSKHAKSETVYLQANQDILNRNGLTKQTVEVNVNVPLWQQAVNDGDIFLDIPDDEMPVRMEPNADGVFVPEDSDSRWEDMERRQPTGEPLDTPRPRRTAPTFSDPDPPGYSGP